APGYPSAQRHVVALRRDQLVEHVLLEELPGFRITKEAGHADQKVPPQRLNLRLALSEQIYVFGDALDLVQAHAALDTPPEGVLAVATKVVSRFGPQQLGDRQ